MRWFTRTLAGRVAFGYLLALVLLGLSWSIAATSAASVSTRYARTVKTDDALLDTISQRIKLMDDQETGLRGYLLTGDRRFLEPYYGGFRNIRSSRIRSLELAIGNEPLLADMRELTARGKAWQQWAAVALRGTPLTVTRSTVTAQQLAGKRLFDQYRLQTARIIGRLNVARGNDLRLSDDATRVMNALLATVFVVGLALLVSVGWLVTRATSRSVITLRRSIEKIAGGDLDHAIKVRGPEELVELARSMETMRVARREADITLRSSRDRLAAIITTQNQIALAEQNLQPVLDLIAERSMDLTGAAGGVLEIVDGTEMVYRAASGAAESHMGLRVQIDKSLSGLCVHTGTLLECQDSETDPRVDREACRQVGARSMLVVPLRRGSEIAGVLKVTAPTVAAFSDQDKETLELLAGQAATAMVTASEFESRRARLAEREEALDRIRASEAELRLANAELERVSRVKSDFLASMSHEIRTPMNGIIGMTGLLVASGLTPEQQSQVQTVQASGEALLVIINDILDFSKIEAGHLQLDEEDVDVRRVVEEVAELFAAQARSKRVEVASLCFDAVPDRIVSDPTRIRQILTNLVGNAVKFTERGEVVITATTEAHEGDRLRLRFEVRDTGIGMGEDTQARIFEAFTQADASTTRRYGGTGLGLTISRRLTELLGGQIGVNSREGEGSTFWFTIEAGVASDHRESSHLPPSLAGVRVLIVDDNRTNRTILEYQLRSAGAQVVLTTGAEAALHRVRSEVASHRPFDLAILDLDMPVVDGIELAEQLKAEPAGAALPILMLASMDLPSVASRPGVRAVDAHLLKPARRTRLLEHVAHLTGRAVAPRLAELAPVQSPTEQGHILVVEDSVVNQRVATGLLERLGYTCSIAANGVEALKFLALSPADAVLMDCYMPEMDGYEATRRIREDEQVHGGHVPIIAMTASALRSEEERCHVAGMDGYLTKPVRSEQLRETLAGLVQRSNTTPSFDATTLASLADLGLLDELLPLFVSEAERTLSDLRLAIGERDADAAMQAAHRLHGSAANVGARPLSEVAAELERLGRSGSIADAGNHVEQLEREFNRIRQSVTDMSLRKAS